VYVLFRDEDGVVEMNTIRTRNFALVYLGEFDVHGINEMIIPQLTVSSFLGFNASLGQGLDLRGRKTVYQRGVMARVLRLARNRWSGHFEKRKKKGKEKKRGGVDFNAFKAKGTSANRSSVNSACVQLCLGGIRLADWHKVQDYSASPDKSCADQITLSRKYWLDSHPMPFATTPSGFRLLAALPI
jgi:hypothetical protein